jgi:hypothetical protein
MSQWMTNWTVVAPKYNVVGFLSCESDGTNYLKPRPLAEQALQFAAAKRWSMGGIVAMFHTSRVNAGLFNYTTGSDTRDHAATATAPAEADYSTTGAPLAPPGHRTNFNDLAAAATIVQASAPTLPTTPTVTLVSAGNYRVAGRATSTGITGATSPTNGAIRQVKVKIGSGNYKAATMTLKLVTGLEPTLTDLKNGIAAGWYQSWTVDLTGSAAQTVTIVVEDTHLNTTTDTSLST